MYMKNLSLDNGNTYIDFENVTDNEKDKIETYWNEIVMFMDDEDREETNNLTSVYTDTAEEKIDYL